MENIEKLVRERRSFRTFEERPISAGDLEKLRALMDDCENPYGIPVGFTLMDAKKDGLTCPVVVGTDTYVGGRIQRIPNAPVAFGYSFEKFILHAQSLGIGTVWLGGTMDRAAFERAMQLGENEMMPCATPLGYPAQKMSVRETMMRKAIKADSRLPFAELFFAGSFDTPLTESAAGRLLKPLEAVRMAPSAVNKQPWRVIVTENAAHFYLKRTKGFTGDMQSIDLGIALCHFDLSAKENGVDAKFTLCDPGIAAEVDVEYVASFLF